MELVLKESLNSSKILLSYLAFSSHLLMIGCILKKLFFVIETDVDYEFNKYWIMI